MDQTSIVGAQKPKRIGRYDLLAKIAMGGMAEIYLARMEGPGGFEKLVVIKRILPHLAEDQHFIDMFLDEAAIAAKLDHPNIVQIYDLGMADGEFFLAMEYLPGASFADLIVNAREENRWLDPNLCVSLIDQACSGLHFAHSANSPDGEPLGIVHRDINHRNVIATFSGMVKIVDFGIAKARGRMSVTRTGGIKGTFPYMSPEQCSGDELDRRSDIFSLGIVFWELLSARKLFKRESEMKTFLAITNDPIPPLSACRPAVDPGIERIIQKALARNRDERYQDAREFQLDLHALLDSKGVRYGMTEIAAYMESNLHRHMEKHRNALERVFEQSGNSSPLSLVSHDTEAEVPSGDFSAEIISMSDKGTTVSAVEIKLEDIESPSRRSRHVVLAVVVAVVAVIAMLAAGAYWIWGTGDEATPPPKASTDTDPQAGTRTAVASLMIETEPKGASVYLDDKAVPGLTPMNIADLAPGRSVRVRAVLQGFESVEKDHQIEPGETARLSLTLTRLPASIELLDAPAGATVRVDGEIRGTVVEKQPLIIELQPEVDHTVRVEKKGFSAHGQTLRLSPGETRKLPVKLVRRRLSHGTLEVNCVPWCRIYIDGRDTGRNSPAKGLKLTVGRHQLRVVNPPTGLSKTRTVEINKGKNTRTVIRLR